MSESNKTDDDEYRVYVSPTGARRVMLKGAQIVCDFCMAPEAPWVYPCGNMPIMGHRMITHSDDPWGACDECHNFIEADQYDMLVEHMIKKQKEHRPPDNATVYPPEDLMRVFLRQNVINFRKARIGPVERDLFVSDE